MLNDSQLVAFAATRQADRAMAFYRDVLGLRMTEDSPFAIVFDANGTVLRLQKVDEHTPARHTALGWQVSGIWRTPDGAQVAWFKDPDGNTLSLTQSPGP